MAAKTFFNHEQLLKKQRLFYLKHPSLHSAKLPNLERNNFALPEIRELVLWLRGHIYHDKNK